jgi:hypothetical protein
MFAVRWISLVLDKLSIFLSPVGQYFSSVLRFDEIIYSGFHIR